MRRVLTAIGVVSAILPLALVVLNIFFRTSEPDDPDNYILVKKNWRGEVLRMETKVNGCFEGPYYANVARFCFKGTFTNDVKIGLWQEWYPNGQLRNISLYSDCCLMTNANKIATMQSTMIYSKDFDSSGAQIGFSTNGCGVRCETFSGSNAIQLLHTIGCQTNYAMIYSLPASKTEKSNSRRYFLCSAPLPLSALHIVDNENKCVLCQCTWNERTGMLQEVYEWDEVAKKSREVKFGASGEVVMTHGERPLFLQGNPVYYPSLHDGTLCWDQMIVYTNGITYGSHLETPLKKVKLW